MRISTDLIRKYANLSPSEGYQYAHKQLKEYLNSATCTRIRSSLCLTHQGATVLATLFVFRFLLPFYEPYGHYSLKEKKWKDSNVKTVGDVVKSMQTDYPTFLEMLDDAVQKLLTAITQDSVSYCLLSRHPIQKPSTSAKQETISEESYLSGINNIQLGITGSDIQENRTLSQLILDYKEMPPSALEEIRSGLEAYVNFFLVEDQAYSKSDAIDDNMAIIPEDIFSKKYLAKIRRYAWYILQLLPVAVFISINMAKNQRPSDKALFLSSEKDTQPSEKKAHLKQGVRRFGKIGKLLEEAINYCFHSTFDDSDFFRKNQDKFLQTELMSPNKLALCNYRRERTNEASSAKYSVRFYDEDKSDHERKVNPYIYAYKEITKKSSPKATTKEKRIEKPTNAYEVFKQLLDLSTVRYESTQKTLSFQPNRALNWMVFEQLTGFLTIADYDVCYYADRPLDPFRGSHFAYQLRNMEVNFPSFSSLKFLKNLHEEHDTPAELLSEFIKKTSLSFSGIPLVQMPFDDSPDYISWVSEKFVQQEEVERMKKEFFDNSLEIEIDTNDTE